MTEFEDHELYHTHSHTSNVYITYSQDTIVSYCKVETRRFVYLCGVMNPATVSVTMSGGKS